jgi:hypothetical protein
MVLAFFGSGMMERGLCCAAREIRRGVYVYCCDKRTITTSQRVTLIPLSKVKGRLLKASRHRVPHLDITCVALSTQ